MYSIYVAVEFRTLRSHDGVGLEYFHDFRRGSRCGAKRFGVGGDVESSKWDSVPLWNTKNSEI